MVCRLFGGKQLPELSIGHLRHASLKFESKYKIFIHENAFENVICGIVAILSRGDELNRIC